MQINQKKSSQNAVVQAKEEIGLEGTTRFDGLFKQWAKDCDNAIGTTMSTLKTKVFCATVSECRIEVPCSLVAVYPMIFYGKFDCDECTEFINYVDKLLMSSGISNNPGVRFSFTFHGSTYRAGTQEFDIRDGKIILNDKSLNGKEVSVIGMFRETDEQGFIMTHQEYIRPMIAYITLKYAKRSRFTGVPYKFHRLDIHDMAQEYHQLVRLARGDANFTSQEGEERIKNLINSSFSGTGHVHWLINNSPIYIT